MERRFIAIPFKVGKKRIKSLEDLKQVLSENPSLLLDSLKDGRLTRFLEGISPSYLSCLDKNNPKESLQKLAKKLGINITSFSLTESSVANASEAFLKLIKSGVRKIELPRGEMHIKELILDRPIHIKGQGERETVLNVTYLEISSLDVIFEDLNIKGVTAVLRKNPCLKNVKMNYLYMPKFFIY